MPPVLDEISHVPASDLYFIASLKSLRSGAKSESGRTDTVKTSLDIFLKIEKEKDIFTQPGNLKQDSNHASDLAKVN